MKVKTCDAYWNGKLVGVVKLKEKPPQAMIRCNLPDGWIYRAVLYAEDKVCARFGVLMPENGTFTAVAALHPADNILTTLHCEVIRNTPGNRNEDGAWLTLEQCLPWSATVFALNPLFSYFTQKKNGVLYRIYRHTNYILFPMDLDRSDPLAMLYCVGTPVRMGKTWYLRISVDKKGEIILPEGDET